MHRKIIGFTIAIALLTAGSLYAQHADTSSVAGNWNISVPDHDITIRMELEQEGHQLSGNFLIPEHGDLFVLGEFSGDSLLLEAVEGSYMQLTIQAQIQADGTLAGTFSGDIGEMEWTAYRVHGK